MKKQYLLSLALLSANAVCLAQGPTITSAVVPTIGSSSTFRTFNAQDVSPGSADTGTTWDFSSVSVNGYSITEYKDPSGMQGSGPFTGANLGADQGVDLQIFFKSTASELSMIGSKFQTLTENYKNNPREALRFPISHGDLFVDSFAGSAQLSTFNADRTGDITIAGDGYGTLILPYGTFNNVLRIRTIAVYEDKFLGNVVNSGVDTIYSWYSEDVKDYLFNWSHITASTLGETFYGVYLDTMFVGIDAHASSGDHDLKAYPNPTSDLLIIEFNSENEDSFVVELYNATGQRVKVQDFQTNENHKYQIPVDDLKRGMHTLLIRMDGISHSNKILIQ